MVNGTRTPSKTVKKTLVLDFQTIAVALVNEPDALFQAGVDRDTARAAYESNLTTLSIAAMTAEIFTAKDGTKRAAANDTERKLAIEQAITGDEEAAQLRADLEARQRDVSLHRNRLESYQLIARLLIQSTAR